MGAIIKKINKIKKKKEGDSPAQKIVSNNQKISENIDESMRGPQGTHKVYGQIWDLEKDHLTVNFEKQKLLIEGKSYSKRTYLDLLLLII